MVLNALTEVVDIRRPGRGADPRWVLYTQYLYWLAKHLFVLFGELGKLLNDLKDCLDFFAVLLLVRIVVGLLWAFFLELGLVNAQSLHVFGQVVHVVDVSGFILLQVLGEVFDLELFVGLKGSTFSREPADSSQLLGFDHPLASHQGHVEILGCTN